MRTLAEKQYFDQALPGIAEKISNHLITAALRQLLSSGNGPERALEAITPSIAHSAKAPTPASFPASEGPIPPPPTQQRERAGASIGSDPPFHRAQRESLSFPKLPCERRTHPNPTHSAAGTGWGCLEMTEAELSNLMQHDPIERPRSKTTSSV